MANFDRLDIAKKLQAHHYFFRAFWDIGNPIIGPMSDLKTAAISFDKEGNAINLLINEDYWNSLNEHTQLFLICHEMAHIVFQHGKKLIEYIGDKAASRRMNVACDIVINEMLCRSFGFVREQLNESLKDHGCWYDTVFKDRTVAHGESTEYYFNLLSQFPDARKRPNGEGMSVCDGECDYEEYDLDSHRVQTEDESDSAMDILGKSGVLSDIDEEFMDGIPTDDRNNVRSAVGTGGWQEVEKKRVSKKKKWESVIKKWENHMRKDEFHEDDRWERVSPRYSQILSPKTHLPTVAQVLDECKTKSKIDVFFFLDTSGSCIRLASRFFDAAKSLDPRRFNVRLFCFDTKVKETTIESHKVYGGGGTSFTIIEQKIQQLVNAKESKYPKAVFVITDGHGDIVSPEKPKAWHWFLTNSGSTYCIPKESHVYKLGDYE